MGLRDLLISDVERVFLNVEERAESVSQVIVVGDVPFSSFGHVPFSFCC